jgi:hypothetical protein
MKVGQFMKESGEMTYEADMELFHGGKIAQFDTQENGKMTIFMDPGKCHGRMEVFMTDHGFQESVRVWGK